MELKVLHFLTPFFFFLNWNDLIPGSETLTWRELWVQLSNMLLPFNCPLQRSIFVHSPICATCSLFLQVHIAKMDEDVFLFSVVSPSCMCGFSPPPYLNVRNFVLLSHPLFIQSGLYSKPTPEQLTADSAEALWVGLHVDSIRGECVKTTRFETSNRLQKHWGC